MSNIKNIHICLVSNHLLANYIPILMKKPDIVEIVSTKRTIDDGSTKRFQEMLDNRNIRYELELGELMPSTGLADIYSYCRDRIERIISKYPQATITLNITGGTKLMALGFYAAISGKDNTQVIYTDTQHGFIEYPDNRNNVSQEQMKDVLKIRDYLKAYGANYRVSDSQDPKWREKVESRRRVTEYLADNAVVLSNFISKMNWMASKALTNRDKKLLENKKTQKINDLTNNKEALNILAESKIIKWNNDKKITFIDVEKTRYLKGIWLEEYAYLQASELKPKDIACGVELSWDQSDKNTKNELDLVIVHNNQILIMECKTVAYEKDYSKGANILYKLNSLADDLKGLYGKVWLINAKSSDKIMLDRAKDREINIIEPSELKYLKDKIKTWMDNI